jgi:hypothetical protein
MSCGSMSLHRYIENQLFRPPKPLFHYPYDLLRNEDCYVSELCQRIYEETGVPSVCHTHANAKCGARLAAGLPSVVLCAAT